MKRCFAPTHVRYLSNQSQAWTPRGYLAPPTQALSGFASSAFHLSFFQLPESMAVSQQPELPGKLGYWWMVELYLTVCKMFRSPYTHFSILHIDTLECVLCSFISVRLNTGVGQGWDLTYKRSIAPVYRASPIINSGPLEITGDQCNYEVYQEQCCIQHIQKGIKQPLSVTYNAPLLLWGGSEA